MRGREKGGEGRVVEGRKRGGGVIVWWEEGIARAGSAGWRCDTCGGEAGVYVGGGDMTA